MPSSRARNGNRSEPADEDGRRTTRNPAIALLSTELERTPAPLEAEVCQHGVNQKHAEARS